MKQTVIIGILLGILLLTGCDNNEKNMILSVYSLLPTA